MSETWFRVSFYLAMLALGLACLVVVPVLVVREHLARRRRRRLLGPAPAQGE